MGNYKILNYAVLRPPYFRRYSTGLR